MQTGEIKVGGVYEGAGPHALREVDHIWNGSRGTMVHWFSQFAVSTPSGRMIHTPNPTCSLERFARWATARLETDAGREQAAATASDWIPTARDAREARVQANAPTTIAPTKKSGVHAHYTSRVRKSRGPNG